MKRLLALIILLWSLPTCAQYITSGFNPGPTVTTITLGGNGLTGGTVTCGFQGICMTPILMQTGASGYTLSSFNVNITTPSGGQIIPGIYSASSNANCPTGISFCANNLVCSASAISAASGNNTIPAASFSSCGTFTANTFYFLAIQTSGGAIALTSTASNGLYCPGVAYWEFTGPNQGSFVLPASNMGSQTEPSATQCPAISAVFNCVGSCGVGPTPWTIFTNDGNTNGANVTTTTLATGSDCLNGTFAGTLTAGVTTYSNTQTRGLRTGANCNGSTFTGGTMSISRTGTSGDLWQYNIKNSVSGSNSVDMLFWVYNVSNTMSSGAQFDLGEIDGGNTITFGAYFGTQCGTSPCFAIERSGGTTAFFGSVPFSTATWYALAILNVSGGTHQAAVFDTTGTQIASQTNTCADGKTICIASDASGGATGIKQLCDGSCASSGGNWFYGTTLLDPLGTTFSSIGTTYGEIFFPDSPFVVGKELSAKVHEGEIPHAEIRDGRWWSYALNRYLDTSAPEIRSLGK
jgi:hypothetical protein